MSNITHEEIKEVTLQDLINVQIKGGITDLEINIINKNHIEIGYWSFSPVTLYVIKKGILLSSIFPRFDIKNGYFGNVEQIKENLNYVYYLIDNKTIIDTSNIKNIVGVMNIFTNHK